MIKLNFPTSHTVRIYPFRRRLAAGFPKLFSKHHLFSTNFPLEFLKKLRLQSAIRRKKKKNLREKKFASLWRGRPRKGLNVWSFVTYNNVAQRQPSSRNFYEEGKWSVEYTGTVGKRGAMFQSHGVRPKVSRKCERWDDSEVMGKFKVILFLFFTDKLLIILFEKFCIMLEDTYFERHEPA